MPALPGRPAGARRLPGRAAAPACPVRRPGLPAPRPPLPAGSSIKGYLNAVKHVVELGLSFEEQPKPKMLSSTVVIFADSGLRARLAGGRSRAAWGVGTKEKSGKALHPKMKV